MEKVYHARMQLVSLLIDALFPPRSTERLVRSLTPDMLAERLAPATLSLDNTSVTALLPYHDPVVAACIQEAKYHGNQKWQELLGQLLGEYLTEYVLEERAFGAKDVRFVPIPLSRKRYKERGYNQSERILFHAQVPIARSVLVRTKETRAQTMLGRHERIENMRSAFSARDIDADVTYVIVDDVTTTGSTLGAAYDAFAHNRTQVRLVALAYQT